MPSYRFQGKVTLPVDPGYRDTMRIKDILVLQQAPDGLFGSVVNQVINAITENMAVETTNGIVFGLILNMIQGLPVETREAYIASIAQGYVFTLTNHDGTLVGDMVKKVDSIDLDSGVRETPSGLILPRSVDLE